MTDINVIFDIDPLNLTREDITEVIAYMRKASANFALGEKSAGNAKKAAAPKLQTVKIDLASLGLKKG
jgi:hypothetical protein